MNIKKDVIDLMESHLTDRQYMPDMSNGWRWSLRSLWLALKIGMRTVEWHINREAWSQERFNGLAKSDLMATIRFDPTRYAGEAIKLANVCGIQLDKGSAFSTIRAVKPDWEDKYNWVERADVRMAICDLLVNYLEDQREKSNDEL